MLILAFDTASPAVTVAVHDGIRVLAEHTVVDARRHGELLAPGIALVCADAGCSVSQLSKLAVGVGPGPFTGLRVGLMTARAMFDALGIPVVGVCSLDILAAAVSSGAADLGSGEPYLVATDARRREVYWALYDATGRRTDGPFVGKATDIGWTGPAFGAGALLYKESFASAQPPELPSAGMLAAIVANESAEFLPPDPLYLRRPDAVEPVARKAVSPQ